MIFLQGTTGQNMAQQFGQLVQSNFDRWNQLGDQITVSIGNRMEALETQIEGLVKELRLTLLNHNSILNNTKT